MACCQAVTYHYMNMMHYTLRKYCISNVNEKRWWSCLNSKHYHIPLRRIVYSVFLCYSLSLSVCINGSLPLIPSHSAEYNVEPFFLFWIIWKYVCSACLATIFIVTLSWIWKLVLKTFLISVDLPVLTRIARKHGLYVFAEHFGTCDLNEQRISIIQW